MGGDANLASRSKQRCGRPTTRHGVPDGTSGEYPILKKRVFFGGTDLRIGKTCTLGDNVR